MSLRFTLLVPILGLVLTAGFAGRYVQLAYGAAEAGPDESMLQIQSELGYELMAPTLLPPRTRIYDKVPTLRGNRRVITSYINARDEISLVFAQERRSAERDDWNQSYLEGLYVTPTTVNGSPAGFSRDSAGRLRICWADAGLFFMLSSVHSDQAMLKKVAESVQ